MLAAMLNQSFGLVKRKVRMPTEAIDTEAVDRQFADISLIDGEPSVQLSGIEVDLF